MAPSTASESTISIGYPESDMSKDDIIADLRRQLQEASVSSAASSAGESIGRGSSSSSRGRRRRRNRNRDGSGSNNNNNNNSNAVSTALTTHFANQRNFRPGAHQQYHAPPPPQQQPAPMHPGGAPASTAEKKKGVPRLQLGLNLNVNLELKAHLEGDLTIALLVEDKPSTRPASSTELKLVPPPSLSLLRGGSCARGVTTATEGGSREVFFMRLGRLRLTRRWLDGGGGVCMGPALAACACAAAALGFAAGYMVALAQWSLLPDLSFSSCPGLTTMPLSTQPPLPVLSSAFLAG
ncbi:hypothetical protein MAPG_03133 [Magnaporthiopsis poae ATCC 64411]|uniref:Uncharacterized protein n=1 Tax=Magnaporthiopsis poae (strain ATCC 64411 / 73-15) TaxID=644358 RepID=A0A0C4DT74_MAGP6|nr:hypothetical protein MAPG_03133 [Magnaporthiopsis poae ATCC 64411]